MRSSGGAHLVSVAWPVLGERQQSMHAVHGRVPDRTDCSSCVMTASRYGTCLQPPWQPPRSHREAHGHRQKSTVCMYPCREDSREEVRAAERRCAGRHCVRRREDMP